MAHLSTRLLTGGLVISTLLTDGKATVVSTFVCKLPLGTVFNSLGAHSAAGPGHVVVQRLIPEGRAILAYLFTSVLETICCSLCCPQAHDWGPRERSFWFRVPGQNQVPWLKHSREMSGQRWSSFSPLFIAMGSDPLTHCHHPKLHIVYRSQHAEYNFIFSGRSLESSPCLPLLLAVNAIAGCTTSLRLSHPQLHLSAQGKEIACTLWDLIISPWGPLQSMQQALMAVPQRELKKKNKERRKEKETPALSLNSTL